MVEPELWQAVKRNALARLAPLQRAVIARAQAEQTLARLRDFDESQHPRDDHGRWTDGGGGESTADKPAASRFASMSPSQVTTAMRSLHKQAVKEPLDEAEREIVREYTDYAFGEYNAYLRKGEVASGAYEPVLKRQVERLEGAIRDTSLPEAMTLYRKFGDKTTAGRLHTLAEGETFIDKGFVSTTADLRGIASGYDGDFIEIRVPKGAQGLPTNGYSSSESEYEVILPPNTTFKVVSKFSEGKRMVVELVSG